MPPRKKQKQRTKRGQQPPKPEAEAETDRHEATEKEDEATAKSASAADVATSVSAPAAATSTTVTESPTAATETLATSEATSTILPEEASTAVTVTAENGDEVYAVRQSNVLQGPIILFNKADYEWVLSQEKEGSDVEHQVFEDIVEATKFVYADINSSKSRKRKASDAMPSIEALRAATVTKRGGTKEPKRKKLKKATTTQAKIPTIEPESWDSMVDLLQKYHAKHGHVNIPTTRDREFPGLGEWVLAIRIQMRKFSEDPKKSKILTEERYKMLTDLGLKMRKKRRGKSAPSEVDETRWVERFHELVQYHKDNGHCNVKITDSSKLYFWTRKVREEYQKIVDGKAAPLLLTAPRLASLMEIGFPFAVAKKLRKKYWIKQWDIMVEKLRLYKEKFGTADISGSAEDPPGFEGLANWVSTVRKHIRDYERKGKPLNVGFLTDDRMKQLLAAGFLLHPMQGKKQIIPDGVIPNPMKRSNWDSDWQTRWDSMIDLIEKYNTEFGTTDVPVDVDSDIYPGLGRWVLTVRYYMKQYNVDNGRVPFLDKNKVDKLMSTGFTLRKKSTAPKDPEEQQKEDDENWDIMFNQLVEFKRDHGHITIPTVNKTLSGWVNRMRMEYEKMTGGEKSILTQPRIDQLLALGFNFVRLKMMKFEERAEQWRTMCKDGDKKGPLPKGLKSWIAATQRKYKDFQDGVPTNLSKEWIDQLSEWGFPWEPEPSAWVQRTPQTWEESFQDLLAYKEKHGHVMVPQKNGEWTGLAGWVHRQRRDYFKVMRGQKSYLTQDKIKRLTEVGFSFRGDRKNRSSSSTNSKQDGPNSMDYENDGDNSLSSSDGEREGERGNDEDNVRALAAAAVAAQAALAVTNASTGGPTTRRGNKRQVQQPQVPNDNNNEAPTYYAATAMVDYSSIPASRQTEDV